MKKILWLSQHVPLPRQMARLKKLFGADTQIIHDGHSFGPAQELVERFRASGADDMVVVAPLAMIDHICREGINPLWAEMVQQDTSAGADLSFRRRHYRFVRFRRIKELRLEFMDDFDDGND